MQKEIQRKEKIKKIEEEIKIQEMEEYLSKYHYRKNMKDKLLSKSDTNQNDGEQRKSGTEIFERQWNDMIER